MQQSKRPRSAEDRMAERLPGAAISPSGTDNALLSANGLLFQLPQSLSTTNVRNVRTQYADRTSYSEGEQIRFIWNTGSAYIDPANAMISLDLKVSNVFGVDEAARTFDFGSGAGAASIFSEILIQAKNGKELDRVTHVDKLAAIKMNWLMSTEGKGMLQAAGYEKKFPFGGGNGLLPDVILNVSIPLCMLSGFFRPIVKGTKIPSNLAAGLFIQLTLKNSANIFSYDPPVAAGENITNFMKAPTFVVQNPVIFLQSSLLNDPTQATLMTTSAESGLEYVYTSTYTDSDRTQATTLNQISKKAVSQCLRTFMSAYEVVPGDAGLNIESVGTDSFRTVPISEFEKWQWRLGSSYFPQNPVTKESVSYFLTSHAFDKTRELYSNPSGLDFNRYALTAATIATPISSESRLLLSGAPINNSNVLELQLTTKNLAARQRLFVVWMEYVSVAKCFLNYTDLKI